MTPDKSLSTDFWRFWSAGALSNLGDGIRLTALPLLTAATTRNAFAVSAVMVVTLLPWATVGVIGRIAGLHHNSLTSRATTTPIRTLNAPTGDWAELLVATAYGGELAPNSKKSFDVVSPDGRRLQVKGRILDPDHVGSQVLSAMGEDVADRLRLVAESL